MKERKIILLVGSNNTGKTHYILNEILPKCHSDKYFIIDPFNEYLSVDAARKNISPSHNNANYFVNLMRNNDLLIIEGAFDKRIIDIDLKPLLATHRSANCSIVLVFTNFKYPNPKDNKSPWLVIAGPTFVQFADRVLFFGSTLARDIEQFDFMKNELKFEFLTDMRNYKQ